MRRTCVLASMLLALSVACGLRVAPARAQTVRLRILEGVTVDRDGDDYAVAVQFALPIFYRVHSPLDQGDTVDIQLAPLATVNDGQDPIRSESVHIPRDLPVPIEDVTVEVRSDRSALLEVRFARRLRFSVEQGKDMRSITLRIPVEQLQRARRPVAGAVTGSTSDPAVVARAAELVEEGRRAVTAGEFQRAAALFTKAVALPENPHSPEALELLALVRERTGQLAHAKAEYGQYLERYPDGEGAERVRQRLDALVTARAVPKGPLKQRPRESRPLDFDTFGSAYVAYRRAESHGGDLEGGSLTTDSSFFTDLHAGARLRMETWSLLSRFDGGYRHEFLDGGNDETRVSALYVEAEESELGLTASLGRRSKSDGGVLYRYDGASVSYRLGELWEVGAVLGIPVDSAYEGLPDLDRFVGGLSVELGTLFGFLDVGLYGIAQTEDGFVDRAALGGELRYFEDGRSLAAFLDYDVYFQSLNIAQLVGSWQITDATWVNGYFDYRSVPVLTMRSALFGEGVDDLGSLVSLLPQDVVKDLAEDRTAHSTTINVGASHRLTPTLQLTGDFTAMDLSSVSIPGGFEDFNGTGFEFSYSARLIANDVISPGDIGVLGARFFDGSNLDLVSGWLDARYPIGPNIRLNPRLRVDYRFGSGITNELFIVPALRVDYRVWRLVLDADVGVGWGLPMGGGFSSRADLFMRFGIRYDL